MVKRCLYHLLPFVGGGLYAPILMASPLGIVGMVFLLGRLSCFPSKGVALPTLKSELLALALFSLGFCCFAMPWLLHTLQELYRVPSPWSIVLFALCSLIAFPQYLVFIVLYRLLKKWKGYPFKMNGSQKIILMAMGLAILERYVPQFFPFYIGHSWLQAAPYLGLAPLGGVPLYSFFSFLIVLTGLAWYRTGRLNCSALIMITGFVLINLAIPLRPMVGESKMRTRLVQPNMENALRIRAEEGDSKSRNTMIKRLKHLSLKPSDRTLDLIIWPELTFPIPIGGPWTPTVARDVIEKMEVSLVMGGYGSSSRGTLYNSLFFYDSQSQLQGLYRKQKLVPMVEFLPFGFLNKYLKSYIDFNFFFDKGVEYPLFKTETNLSFLGVICYEIIFSDYVRTYLQNQSLSPHFIINLSNDSWYGDSLEPLQHKLFAHWRALEFNIPVIRANNTGISSVLYPDGSESPQIKFSERGHLDVDVLVRERTPTIFQKYGPWVTWALGSTLFLGVSLSGRRWDKSQSW